MRKTAYTVAIDNGFTLHQLTAGEYEIRSEGMLVAEVYRTRKGWSAYVTSAWSDLCRSAILVTGIPAFPRATGNHGNLYLAVASVTENI